LKELWVLFSRLNVSNGVRMLVPSGRVVIVLDKVRHLGLGIVTLRHCLSFYNVEYALLDALSLVVCGVNIVKNSHAQYIKLSAQSTTWKCEDARA
jgi:hypothetical protein